MLRWLVERLGHPDDVAPLLGDLEEELIEWVVPEQGEAEGRRWMRRQLRRSLPHLLAVRVRRWNTEREWNEIGEGMMGAFVQDLRFTFRSFGKNAGFVAVVVFTLALGIGANTLVYSAVDGLVLNPFPFPDGDRLVAVGTQYPKLGATEVEFIEHIAPLEYVDIRDQSRTLERVVAFDMGNRQVSFGEVTENVFTGFWWGDGLATLGMEPHLGRGMTWEETVRGEPVALLSHRIWTTAFGADEELVGRSIMMNGNPYTVIGIMPPRMVLNGMDLWIPMGVEPEVFPRSRKQWQVMARIRDGVTLREVNTDLEALARQTELAHVAESEEYEGWRMEAETWTRAAVRTFRPAALLTLGAVAFVLLLVCANIGSLLLARSTTRRREMAVRTALGAGRSRLFRQLLTESVTLAGLGGLLGVALAYFGVQAIAEIVAGLPFLGGEVTLNGRVLAFSALVSVAAGILFGLIPALQSARGGISGALKSEGGGATSGGGRLQLQRVFVGVEVALALVLLMGGGLLVNSVIRLNRVDPGYQPENVLTMRLTLPWEEYDGPAIGAFFQELDERVSAMPGVEEVGIGGQFPPIAFSYRRVNVVGREDRSEGELPTAMATLVSTDYFDALGIPLLRGRGLSDLDVEGSPLVTVLNESAARLLFPGEDPIGRQIVLGDAPLEVVGVVGDARNQGVSQPPFPEVFANYRQLPGATNQLFLLVRTSVDPLSVLPGIRRQVREMDPDQPVYAIRTAEELIAVSTASERIAANALSIFAAFALILAAVGIFGVVSFSVAERTREIGLRVALGAESGSVRWLMVRQALTPVILGGIVGLLGAVGVGRALEDLLFQVRGTDPLTLSSVTVTFLGVALLASYLPARRASRLDPVNALREE